MCLVEDKHGRKFWCIVFRVRQDWRPRWSAVLPGPGRYSAIGPWQPEASAETGRTADPANMDRAGLKPAPTCLRGNVQIFKISLYL
jgi:hypothetical protein